MRSPPQRYERLWPSVAITARVLHKRRNNIRIRRSRPWRRTNLRATASSQQPCAAIEMINELGSVFTKDSLLQKLLQQDHICNCCTPIVERTACVSWVPTQRGSRSIVPHILACMLYGSSLERCIRPKPRRFVRLLSCM